MKKKSFFGDFIICLVLNILCILLIDYVAMCILKNTISETSLIVYLIMRMTIIISTEITFIGSRIIKAIKNSKEDN